MCGGVVEKVTGCSLVIVWNLESSLEVAAAERHSFGYEYVGYRTVPYSR